MEQSSLLSKLKIWKSIKIISLLLRIFKCNVLIDEFNVRGIGVCRDDGLHLLTLLNVVTDSYCMPLSFAIFYSMNYRGRYMWDTCKRSEL